MLSNFEASVGATRFAGQIHAPQRSAISFQMILIDDLCHKFTMQYIYLIHNLSQSVSHLEVKAFALAYVSSESSRSHNILLLFSCTSIHSS